MSQICWIRRDLRLHDHAALSKSLMAGETTVVFVFDRHILDQLSSNDRRITFIHESLVELEHELHKKGSSLVILYGKPEEEIPKLAKVLNVEAVHCNRDYEPYAKERDALVAKRLSTLKIDFHQYKDSVVFESAEVLTGSGANYKVYTPYKNKWLETLRDQGNEVPLFPCPLGRLRKFVNPQNVLNKDWFKETGFSPVPLVLRGGTKPGLKQLKAFENVILKYDEARNYPARAGTSSLSVYLRFGCLSVRDLIRAALANSSEGSRAWLSELIWRDFYQMILDRHPRVVNESFKPEYDRIRWLGKKEHFNLWSEGKTGFPIVDAAMRCLNETGMMHNRLRMITASFLCKILLVNYRLGETYFAEKLLDFDLAANDGGWQWSSSSGCDAQPYFRIFNPYLQSQKFDPDGDFIRKWCPELSSLSKKDIHRPPNVIPIVEYEKNRERCLLMYAPVKTK